MKVQYANQQNKLDPMNGAVIEESVKLAELLNSKRNEPPFLGELSGDNGYHIEFGIGGDIGCVQFSSMDGDPPYLMAVSTNPPMKCGYVEFLISNTPTPFAARYIISFDELKEIALHFMKTGERSNRVLWQELNPRAVKEDAERRNLN
jgi:Immunity protein Imm1